MYTETLNLFQQSETPYYLVALNEIVTTENHGNWCQLPYPNHPKGCPYYDNKVGCPPNQPPILDMLNVNKPKYFIYSEFDVLSHMKRMKGKHPHWTKRQQRNVLYWQPKNRKILRQRVEEQRQVYGFDLILYVPEAHGVNIYATAYKNGLTLQKICRLEICKHVALVGFKR